jgi:hypothetical protein
MDHALNYRIQDAQDKVFQWMQEYVGFDRESGSKELFDYPDWQEAWENWWDEGDD